MLLPSFVRENVQRFSRNCGNENFRLHLPEAHIKLVFISGRRSRGERLLTYLGLPVATAALVLLFKVLRTLPQFYSVKVALVIYHLMIDRYCVVPSDCIPYPTLKTLCGVFFKVPF
jgi:hypothetical protein